MDYSHFNSFEAKLHQIDNEISQLKTSLAKAAKDLSLMRQVLAQDLSSKITNNLLKLSFTNAKFKIDVQTNSFDEWQFSGPNTILFSVKLNAGSPFMPLKSVASGGELSRIFLSFNDLIVQNSHISMIIFDEIDSGIGGFTANRVADFLKQLSLSHQILLVTHLPQIASRATQHYFINKEHIQIMIFLIF